MDKLHSFEDLELMQLVVESPESMYAYATFNSYSTIYEFHIRRAGEILGKCGNAWAELTEETSAAIRRLIAIQGKNVPVYYEGRQDYS